MAIRTYPATVGYARWHAWRQHSSEVSPFLESGFLPASLAIPVRPQGVLLWRGQFETPVYGPSDQAWVTMRTLMESVDDGVHQLRLTVPADQRRSGVLGTALVVQPVRIDAPVRGSRGETRGWGVEWVEHRGAAGTVTPVGKFPWSVSGTTSLQIDTASGRRACFGSMSDAIPATSMADGLPGMLSAIRLGATAPTRGGTVSPGVVRANFGSIGSLGIDAIPDSLTASARNGLSVTCTVGARTVTADNFDADGVDPHDAPGHAIAQAIADNASAGDTMTYRVSSTG